MMVLCLLGPFRSFIFAWTHRFLLHCYKSVCSRLQARHRPRRSLSSIPPGLFCSSTFQTLPLPRCRWESRCSAHPFTARDWLHSRRCWLRHLRCSRMTEKTRNLTMSCGRSTKNGLRPLLRSELAWVLSGSVVRLFCRTEFGALAEVVPFLHHLPRQGYCWAVFWM